MLLVVRLRDCCIAPAGQLGPLLCFHLQHAVSRRIHICREVAPEPRPPTSSAPCTPASTRSSPLPTSPQRRGLSSSASMRMPWAIATGITRSGALQMLLFQSLHVPGSRRHILALEQGSTTLLTFEQNQVRCWELGVCLTICLCTPTDAAQAGAAAGCQTLSKAAGQSCSVRMPAQR